MSGEFIAAHLTAPAASVEATNGSGGPSTATITAGTYGLDEVCAELETQLNTACPSGWTVVISTTTGLVTIDCSDTDWSITWTSTALRDLLGFAADIASASSAQTGTRQAKGLWFPHCPLMLDGDPRQAPRADDGRASVSPTGAVYKVVGVSSYRHRNVRFTHVPQAYVWARSAALQNCDYETWYLDTQAGLGHSWFSPASVCVVGWDNAGSVTTMGSASVNRWQFPSPQAPDELVLSAAPWTGYVTVVMGDARSNGVQ